MRDLVQNTPLGREYIKEKWGGEGSVSKLLPKDLDFSVDLMISGDDVAMISFDSMVAIIIENKGIAQLQESFFKYIWHSLK